MIINFSSIGCERKFLQVYLNKIIELKKIINVIFLLMMLTQMHVNMFQHTNLNQQKIPCA